MLPSLLGVNPLGVDIKGKHRFVHGGCPDCGGTLYLDYKWKLWKCCNLKCHHEFIPHRGVWINPCDIDGNKIEGELPDAIYLY